MTWTWPGPELDNIENQKKIIKNKPTKKIKNKKINKEISEYSTLQNDNSMNKKIQTAKNILEHNFFYSLSENEKTRKQKTRKNKVTKKREIQQLKVTVEEQTQKHTRKSSNIICNRIDTFFNN